jgi:4-diphosphocytidyl-2-C-methyl-D-erythritol kinase
VTVVHLVAPAKLTLTLAVTGVRDDGYHLIDAEMVALDLADDLEVDPDGDWLRIEGRWSDGVPADGTNLVSRALRLAGRGAGVTVRKNIPHGGGLGGGSADAGAILRWAGHSDPQSAATIGADVPFCASGLARARVGGIGEVVEALPPRELAVTLVIPPLSVPTHLVYDAWDRLDPADRNVGRNELETAALVVEPRLRRWRDRIGEAAILPTLAGSGATWFLEGHHHELVDALPDAVVVLTTTRTG